MGWMGHVHSRSYKAVYDRFFEDEIQPELLLCADAAGSHYAVAKDDAERDAVTNEDYVSAIVRFDSGARGFLEAARQVALVQQYIIRSWKSGRWERVQSE